MNCKWEKEKEQGTWGVSVCQRRVLKILVFLGGGGLLFGPKYLHPGCMELFSFLGILGSGFALKVQQQQRQKHMIRRLVC
jgi:hypothetical protein